MTKANDPVIPAAIEEMLKTGLVDYAEVIIDRPVEEVWAALPEYRKWNPSHVTAKHTTIKGEPGAVGEVVEILKVGAAEPYFVETVRIRDLQTVDGTHKVGNLVWKAYDKRFSFCNFVDFGVREYQGKTIFYRSYYTQTSPTSEAFVKMRQHQAEGKPDPLSEATVAIKEYLEATSAKDPDSKVRKVRMGRKSGVHIKSVIRREETVIRHGGVGDNWHMSWAADDRQYASLCDGFGFSGQNKYLYNANMVAIEGGPQDAKFRDLPTYPLLAYYPSQKLANTRYYPFGTLALDGRLYQFMTTFNRGLLLEEMIGPAPPADADLLRFNGVKLVYSPDNGRIWCNQDGTTPVGWEDWPHRSKDTMVFFNEDQEAFSLLTVLQMGKNYEDNRDGYVYVYAPNGNTEGTMNELVMFRVPKGRILERSAYEYFAGLQNNGAPKWSHDILARKPTYTFPRGWVNTHLHPYAWHPSVSYNAQLGLYMMANWAPGVSANGNWFAKPSYLGFWVSTTPWGPWTQIHEESAWMPQGDQHARAYEPQIAPKWIAPDGKSFWLVWTDLQVTGDKAEYERMNAPLKNKSNDDYTLEDWALKYDIKRKFNAYYAFNTQRVDLVL